jgi:hypothetical protein
MAGFLAGCAEQADRFRNAYHALVSNGPAHAPAVKAREPRYCYRTLGKVTCYTTPLPGSENNRIVGFEGPALAS